MRLQGAMWLGGLLLAGAGTPALARPVLPPAPPAIDRTYLHARAAAALGDEAAAATLLGRASAAAPADADLALRAFTVALRAGDRPLASAAAARLAAQGRLPVQAALLRYADALDAHDGKGAQAALDMIARDRSLGSLAALLRAWMIAAAHGDPLAALGPELRTPDLAVHRALLAIAAGQVDAGAQALEPALAQAQGSALHVIRLRIAGAAALAGAGRSRQGEQLLAAGGAEPALTAARALIAAGRPVPEAITGPQEAAATALAAIATDLARDRASPASLLVARLAMMIAPADAEARIVFASMAGLRLGNSGIAALEAIPPADPLAGTAGQLLVTLLAASGDKEAALARATALAATAPTPQALISLGDSQSAVGKYRDAAETYQAAGALAERTGATDPAPFTYDLLAGGAFDQAGDWSHAKPLLRRAAALAPDDPTALNYLGYASLEKHEDVARATALIERAHKIAPDNGAITDSLGWAYYLTGRVADAVPVLEAAVVAEPADPTINEHLGDAYWAAGRQYEARYAWRAASVAAGPADAARLAAKIAGGPPEPRASR